MAWLLYCLFLIILLLLERNPGRRGLWDLEVWFEEDLALTRRILRLLLDCSHSLESIRLSWWSIKRGISKANARFALLRHLFILMISPLMIWPYDWLLRRIMNFGDSRGWTIINVSLCSWTMKNRWSNLRIRSFPGCWCCLTMIGCNFIRKGKRSILI